MSKHTGRKAGTVICPGDDHGQRYAPKGMRVFDGQRNKRSVWTVTTKSFRGAHFATFPPDLIEPCILAGCPEGGVVLDPFFGTGTTGMVAAQHNRNAIGIELNSEYVDIASARLRGEKIRASESATAHTVENPVQSCLLDLLT